MSVQTARIFTEGSLACLATDINEILYLNLSFFFFFLTLELSVSDIQTVAPTCPYFVGGGGGVSAKYGHARILANAENSLRDRP